MLKKLTESFGVSGGERQVRETIKSEIEMHCDSLTIDNMCNLIAVKNGKSINKKKVVLCAHMDEVGLIVTKITNKGFLKFRSIGGVNAEVLASKIVKVNAVQGVISLKPVHLTTKEERDVKMKFEDLCIDIGAHNKRDAEKYVRAGDYVSFVTDYGRVGENLIKAKALDDRAGCAILIDILKQQWDHVDLYVCFTVQEEVGLRGARCLDFTFKPDCVLVVECTICNDLPNVTEQLTVTKLGGGAAISVLDGGSRADVGLVDAIKKLADLHGIKYQLKASTKGGNDSGVLCTLNGGVKVASVSIPCRYIHSPRCVMDERDYKAVKNLVEIFLREFVV